jgi:uncharacterized SAM-binding protein YcdF (DUF218 family)
LNYIQAITDYIFIDEAPRESDIIFIPGGSHPSLPEKAAELYNGGYAPLLLPSGRYYINLGYFAGVKGKPEIYNGDYETECAFYTDVLIKNGVPRDAVLQEDEATFTKENAVFSRRLTDRLGMKISRAILCCKPFHARRCLTYYQLSFPETEIITVPAPTLGVNKNNWHTTSLGIERVLGELARCGTQFVGELKALLPRV